MGCRIERRKSCEGTGIRRGEYSFTTQATHKPFDALAVDAWATLAAEMGGVDWLLQKGCSALNSDHLMTKGQAGISQLLEPALIVKLAYS
jgi:hypothetical protein